MPLLSRSRAAALLAGAEHDAALRPAADVPGGVRGSDAEGVAAGALAAGGESGPRRALEDGLELAVWPSDLERVRAQTAAALVETAPVQREAVVTAVQLQRQADPG